MLMVYVNAMGGKLRFTILMSWFLLVELCRVGATVWLSYWTGIADNPGAHAPPLPVQPLHVCCVLFACVLACRLFACSIACMVCVSANDALAYRLPAYPLACVLFAYPLRVCSLHGHCIMLCVYPCFLHILLGLHTCRRHCMYAVLCCAVRMLFTDIQPFSSRDANLR